VAKTFILLSDNYVGLKDDFQAKATLQSVIDNYKGNDDILPTAKQKLEQLTPAGKRKAKTDGGDRQKTVPDSTTDAAKSDTTRQAN
jgi:hypothetical protein